MDQRRNSRGAKSSADEEDTRRKVTFLISAENDFKFTVLSRKKGIPRSDLIESAIGEMCRGIVISFRGKSSEEGEAA